MNSSIIWQIIAAIAISFLFLIIVFVPMERIFPAKKGQNFFRPGWLLDFCFFIGQYAVWSFLVLWFLNHFKVFLQGMFTPEFQTMLNSQPFILQVFEVLLFSDFLVYWGHRLQHKVDFLWRFHKVHHSAEHLDWLAAHREHPIDALFTIGLINLPAFVLGFPLDAIAGVIAFRGIWAIYIHSNVRLPIGPIRKIIGAPELHHWHHDLDRNASNYANISPLMDIIFGTYACPDEEPDKFGIKEKTPTNYLGQLLEPLLPNGVWENFEARVRIRIRKLKKMD
jgi:sterol desaturase/sphingolipid hydroxylase (fatty acid hydroxylase superfamily)